MLLKIRCQDGRSVSVQIDDFGTWGDLLTAIYLRLDEPVAQVYAGFPAQAIAMTTSSEASLESLKIRNGDTLTVSTERVMMPMVVDEAPQLVIREMADDNSCLFNAVGYVLLDKSRSSSMELRQLAAQLVRSDPQYDAVMLGMSPVKYAERISEPNCWGGAIELSLFARHFATEIASVDVESGRVDVFGEGQQYVRRAFILYSGIHYDALALALSISDESKDQTMFSPNDDGILAKTLTLAQKARKEHRYTDLAKFTLRCEQCGEAFVGERQAELHAGSTGHTNFVEYA